MHSMSKRSEHIMHKVVRFSYDITVHADSSYTYYKMWSKSSQNEPRHVISKNVAFWHV